MSDIDNNIEKIKAICDQHKVSKLFVFGSVLTNSYKKYSDIDFVVDFKDIDIYNYADNYFDFKKSLEELLNREVDLLEEKAIKNPYLKKNIESSKKLVYGQ